MADQSSSLNPPVGEHFRRWHISREHMSMLFQVWHITACSVPSRVVEKIGSTPSFERNRVLRTNAHSDSSFQPESTAQHFLSYQEEDQLILRQCGGGVDALLNSLLGRFALLAVVSLPIDQLTMSNLFSKGGRTVRKKPASFLLPAVICINKMVPTTFDAPHLLKEAKLFNRVSLLVATYLTTGLQFAFAFSFIVIGARLQASTPKPLSYGSIVIGLVTCGSAVLLLVGVYRSMLKLALQNLVILAVDIVFLVAVFLLAIIATCELHSFLDRVTSEGYKQSIALLIVYCEKAAVFASINTAVFVFNFIIVLRVFMVLRDARKTTESSLMATIPAPPICQAVGSPCSYPIYKYDDQPSTSRPVEDPGLLQSIPYSEVYARIVK
ncbi:hypothetical protein D918_05393 [Trichuris suis]|nr:hypothetical protein D918_05393 [Trichuris suis]